MASSSADVRAVRGRPTFTCAVGVIHFLSHGDAAPIVETYLCLDEVDQDNTTLIPVQRYQLDCYRSQLSTHNNALFIVMTNNTAEKYVNAICLRKYGVQHFRFF
jgi:hypothetical protein